MEQLIPHSDNRESRLNIRASQYQKAVIAEAARAKHVTISNFVLGSAYKEAQEILADTTDIRFPSDKWEAFCSALDREPRSIKALQELLTNSSVFDNA